MDHGKKPFDFALFSTLYRVGRRFPNTGEFGAGVSNFYSEHGEVEEKKMNCVAFFIIQFFKKYILQVL